MMYNYDNLRHILPYLLYITIESVKASNVPKVLIWNVRCIMILFFLSDVAMIISIMQMRRLPKVGETEDHIPEPEIEPSAPEFHEHEVIVSV